MLVEGVTPSLTGHTDRGPEMAVTSIIFLNEKDNQMIVEPQIHQAIFLQRTVPDSL